MYGQYGVGGKLLNAVKSFYLDSKKCNWVGVEVNLVSGFQLILD